jgi:hypothetical protein
MVTPSIAVIVPNWNDARHLPRCLRSALDQKVGPDELIVVDDQSSDDSVEVIRSTIAGDGRAQLVVNPANLGTNGALNEGLRRIKSDYVVFLASNDFVLPGIFAHAKHCLARWPQAGLWSAMAWLVDEEDRKIRLHPSAVVAMGDAYFAPERCVELARRFGNWFTGTTLIYHREALAAVGGFDPDYGAPADLITALTIASVRGAAYSPEPFAAIRIHTGSYSSTTLQDTQRVEQMLAVLRERGPLLAPKLFDAAFLERTALRFRFAAVRSTGGRSIPEVVERLTGARRLCLRLAGCIYPAKSGFGLVALAFVILRPFDLLPTLWYRLCGWVYVRSRPALRRGDEF